MSREAMQQALEALIESARLLGSTQAKKGFGCYSEEDAMLERAWHESIAKHSAALRAALAEQAQPVAWSPRMKYPGWEKQRVWCNGEPRQQDIDYFSKNAFGIDLAYLAPPTPVVPQRLTDEDIEAIPCTDGDGSDWEALLRFARAVEAEVLKRMEVPR